MTQIERALGGYAPPVLVTALFLGVITVLIISRGRRTWIHSYAYGGLVGSVICVLGVTLAPSIGTPSGVELLPFTNAGSANGLAQLLGNLVLTAPSGFFCVLATRSLRSSLYVGGVLCVVVELAQLAPPLGRVASVEDAIVTTLGWVGGSCVAQLTLRMTRRHGRVWTGP